MHAFWGPEVNGIKTIRIHIHRTGYKVTTGIYSFGIMAGEGPTDKRTT